MSRSYRLIIWLAGIIALLGLTYASLPMILSGLVKQTLSAQGLSDIQVNIGYPDWREIRLHKLQFTAIAGGQHFFCQLTDVDVEYHITDLIAGRVALIRVPVAIARVEPAASVPPSITTRAALPLAALVSGQWFSQLPVRELLLQQLTIDWRTPADAAYMINLTGNIRNGEAQVNGEISLLTPQQNQAVFSLMARKTGEARLSLSPADNTTEPMFDLAVNPVSIDHDRLEANGVLNAKFDTLIPLVAPWLVMTDSVAALKGYFKSQLQAVLPAESPMHLADFFNNIKLHSKNTLNVRAERLGRLTKAADGQLKIDARLDAGVIHWQITKDSRFSAVFAALPVRGIEKHQPIVISVPHAMLGQIRFSNGEVDLTVLKDSRLTVRPFTIGGLSLPEMGLTVSEPASMSYWWLSYRWQWDPVTLSLAATSLQGQKNTIHYDDGVLKLRQLHGEGLNLQVAGEARVQGLSGRWRDQPLPRGELHAKFESDPQRATLQTTLSAANQAVVLESNWIHQYTTGNGHADFKLVPVIFTDSDFVLSELLEPWPYPFDITNGRLSAAGRLEWQPSRSADTARQRDLNLQLFLHLDKLGGRHKKVTFAGLNTEMALANGEGVRTIKDAQLSVDIVDVGFPIENIVVQFQLASHPKTREAIVGIQKVAAELLGGRAHSEPFQLDFGRDKNQFMVQLEQINLSDVMQLEQQEGLQGTGRLDGQLPIEITPEGVEVVHGQLSVRAPGGDIRYLPTEKVLTLAQTNPSVKMVVEALSNFQYHVLDVISDYKPGGDLTLQIHLEGKNPDWQAGQPVHLNLNLEENIPLLLRSLQLSDEITERVRKEYQNTR